MAGTNSKLKPLLTLALGGALRAAVKFGIY